MANKGGRREGAGRKSLSEIMGLAETLDGVAPQSRRVEMWKRLLDMSRAPDEKVALKAIELMMAYLYGKPTQTVDVNAKVETEYEVIWSDGAGQTPEAPQVPDGSDGIAGTVQSVGVRPALGQDTLGGSDVPVDGA